MFLRRAARAVYLRIFLVTRMFATIWVTYLLVEWHERDLQTRVLVPLSSAVLASAVLSILRLVQRDNDARRVAEQVRRTGELIQERNRARAVVEARAQMRARAMAEAPTMVLPVYLQAREDQLRNQLKMTVQSSVEDRLTRLFLTNLECPTEDISV